MVISVGVYHWLGLGLGLGLGLVLESGQHYG